MLSFLPVLCMGSTIRMLIPYVFLANPLAANSSRNRSDFHRGRIWHQRASRQNQRFYRSDTREIGGPARPLHSCKGVCCSHPVHGRFALQSPRSGCLWPAHGRLSLDCPTTGRNPRSRLPCCNGRRPDSCKLCSAISGQRCVGALSEKQSRTR